VDRFRIEFIPLDWERFDEVLRLSFGILYEPFGVSYPAEQSKGADWMHPAPGTRIAVAIAPDGELLGSARLLPAEGDAERQIRQVAVFPHARGLGVGRALMLAVEECAVAEGASATWLNARDTAFGFYANLGYSFTGEVFVSETTGIPHRRARKQLG
jgi:predicted GNAT family N-acyltransferase